MVQRIGALTPVMILGFVLVWMSPPVPAAEEAPSEEQSLRAAHLATDNESLISFFKRRASLDNDQEKVAELIKQLSDKSPDVRDKAAGELVAIGTPAMRLLHVAANDLDDRTVATAARKCLESLEGSSGASLPSMAARLLAMRQPPGAAQVLLDYLPSADDEAVIEEIKGALAALALRDNKPDPALVKALEEKNSLRRVAAVEALCQSGREEVAELTRKLLEDKNKIVQLRAALALANFKDAKAVGTLVTLLGDLALPQAKQAEEYLLGLAGEQAPSKATLDKEGDQKKCMEEWSTWWEKTKGPDLLKEFTKRTLKDEDRDKVMALIKRLGDDKFEIREEAEKELVTLSAAAVPLLRQNSGSDNPEIAHRIKKCLQNIGGEKSAALSAVTARLVAIHKPEAAAEALLGYLPFSEDEAINQEVRASLSVVTYRNGKADPAVLKALADKTPIRRAAAAESLCAAGGDEHKEAIRKLFTDEDVNVRLRAEMSLASAKDKEAIPPLIALLGDAPQEVGNQAEEFLRELAGEGAPNVFLDNTDGGKKKCRDAWDGWWKKNSDKVVLGRNAAIPHQLGYTLLICINPNTGMGELVELGTDHKPRWTIPNLQYPMGCQVVGNNKVLITEHNGMRVTERDFKGAVTWEKKCGAQPVSVQRLSNGNTFIATRAQMLEVDRTGKEVFTYNRPNQDICEGKKLRNGQYGFVSQNGEYVRVDSAGKQLKSSRVSSLQWYGCGIEILPNDHVLYPMYGQNKVVEYDGDGKIVWEAQMQLPTSAIRLPNGNTLIASQQSQKVVEVNKAGKVVNEYKGSQFPIRATRR
ncbi:MAG TPA: HEAT repeat domain-containing protein [Gemmataceae bacterium]